MKRRTTRLAGSFSGESAPHHWWIKAPGPNTLDIHVEAFSVNTTEESGSILATLYTPEGQLLDSVQVFHPTGPDFSPGASATATLSGLLLRCAHWIGDAALDGAQQRLDERIPMTIGRL